MPNFNGMGPNNQGPLTGRGLGPCGAGMRLGFGRRAGFGRGFGFRAGFYPQVIQPQVITEADEKKILEAELAEIEVERKEIEKRLKELKE